MDNTYEYYKDMLENYLMDYVPNVDSKSLTIYDSMKYSLTAGGKRLRPVLLLASCEFAGGNPKEALPFAVALEYIHTYSLIHDDLPAMDNDDLRRGKATNHKVYGDGIATLAGDALLNTACEIMLKSMFLHLDSKKEVDKRINAAYAIMRAAGIQGMIAGQVADIEAEGKKCSEDMLRYIHSNKTGALISAAIEAGLYMGEADEESFEKLMDYADKLGLAYQIQDDILDVEGDEAQLGKHVGSDVDSNKSTFVSLFGLEVAKEKLKETAKQAKQAIASYYDNAAFFVDLIDKLENRNS
ncbi:MAG: polyprenyl synthetase family protein [Clostridia bacterium]|nr:polyprenyl synthetase family protein [Clostridia bacterium]